MPRHSTSGTARAGLVPVAALAAALLVAAGLGGWAVLRPDDAVRTTAAAPASTPPAPTAPAVTSTVPVTPSPTLTPTADAPVQTPSAAPTRTAPTGRAAADRAAGLVSRSFPQRGSGRLAVVSGRVAAPGRGKVVRVRVEVEGGLKVDGEAFAAFALATLNDRRSWAHDGYTFARTDGAADVRLVLASPQTSARLCLPLRTFGKLSCHAGSVTVLTIYRWVNGIPEYGEDLTGYRHYVVNHEVGHALGHGHLRCPGRGKRAPVMMQQTKGLLGCTPNGWPYPDAG